MGHMESKIHGNTTQVHEPTKNTHTKHINDMESLQKGKNICRRRRQQVRSVTNDLLLIDETPGSNCYWI